MLIYHIFFGNFFIFNFYIKKYKKIWIYYLNIFYLGRREKVIEIIINERNQRD
jgi:hypothetical protein